MNGMIQTFEKLLEKMRFKEPVPPPVARYVLDYKMKSLVFTLKNFNEYGVIYGFVLRIYFSAKKFGIRLSVAQSKFVLSILSLLAVCVMSALIIFILGTGIKRGGMVDSIINKSIEESTIKKSDNIRPDNSNSISEKISKDRVADIDKSVQVKFRLGIETFRSGAVQPEEANRITDIVTNELIQLKGSNNIKRIYRDIRKNANFILLGSIELLGSSYIISAKIVSVENSKVIFTISDSADSKEGVNAACSRMAKKIAGTLE